MRTAASGFVALVLIPLAGFVASSVYTGAGRETFALLAIWALAGCLRMYHSDRQFTTDYWIFWGCALWVGRAWLGESWRRWDEFVGWERGAVGVVMGGMVAVLWVWRATAVKTKEKGRPPPAEEWEGRHPKAKIFPCKTTHARMFPKKHAFSYSYLQVGFPIIPETVTAGEMHVSSGRDRTLGSWWLRIRAEDYLDRGNADLGFYGKLKMYLREQHVKDEEWSYAYLITAPRFLEYAFNPVSFWYIYNTEHQLKKMILEVNNTFGERRMYLLDGSSPPSPPRTSAGSDVSGDSEPEAVVPTKSRFTDVWMKDFHVSPFNSRKGSYALKALDPFPSVTYDDPKIDNTITLKSSKDHGKLVARLFSTGKAIDPETMGVLGTARFVLSWWWVGLVTFPRIVREAGKLFFKHKLNVFYRPEVQSTSIGRSPTASEITLHKVFSAYLHELVAQTSENFCITFRGGISNIPVEIISSNREPTPDRPTRNLEIRVLTPAFYSRLVHYAYTSEAIDRECVFTDERNRTLWLCRPQLLPLLLSSKNSLNVTEKEQRFVKRNYLDEIRWRLLKRLRCAPPDPVYSATPESFTLNDIRSRPLSELDRFVRSEKGNEFAGEYRRAVTKTFLAQRFAFGVSEVIGGVDLLVRVVLSYFAVLQLFVWDGRREGDGIAWPMKSAEGLMSQTSQGSPGEGAVAWWWVLKSAAVVSFCHTYQWLKGYR
ncbi:hypothetical protein NX059_011896 [Plenodomus lindquistii]|nr:hypothetical protein NX059_011896 [Plenodomus lindquistii]